MCILHCASNILRCWIRLIAQHINYGQCSPKQRHFQVILIELNLFFQSESNHATLPRRHTDVNISTHALYCSHSEGKIQLINGPFIGQNWIFKCYENKCMNNEHKHRKLPSIIDEIASTLAAVTFIMRCGTYTFDKVLVKFYKNTYSLQNFSCFLVLSLPFDEFIARFCDNSLQLSKEIKILACEQIGITNEFSVQNKLIFAFKFERTRL